MQQASTYNLVCRWAAIEAGWSKGVCLVLTEVCKSDDNHQKDTPVFFVPMSGAWRLQCGSTCSSSRQVGKVFSNGASEQGE